jgi:hypothetical protein
MSIHANQKCLIFEILVDSLQHPYMGATVNVLLNAELS